MGFGLTEALHPMWTNIPAPFWMSSLVLALVAAFCCHPLSHRNIFFVCREESRDEREQAVVHGLGRLMWLLILFTL